MFLSPNPSDHPVVNDLRFNLHGENGVVHGHLVVIHVHVDIDLRPSRLHHPVSCLPSEHAAALHCVHGEVCVGHAHGVVVHVHVDGAPSLVRSPGPGHQPLLSLFWCLPCTSHPATGHCLLSNIHCEESVL